MLKLVCWCGIRFPGVVLGLRFGLWAGSVVLIL